MYIIHMHAHTHAHTKIYVFPMCLFRNIMYACMHVCMMYSRTHTHIYAESQTQRHTPAYDGETLQGAHPSCFFFCNS